MPTLKIQPFYLSRVFKNVGTLHGSSKDKKKQKKKNDGWIYLSGFSLI